jgi:hypothetical protein
MPAAETQEVRDIFLSYGISEQECAGVVESLRRRPERLGEFYDAL